MEEAADEIDQLRNERESARQEGWKAGMEEAAKIVEEGDFIPDMPPKVKLIVARCLSDAAYNIRHRINQKD